MVTNRIAMTIDLLRQTLERAQRFEQQGKKLSEIDTQALLVEPILQVAGYDIYDPFVVKRASRNNFSEEFDVQVYEGSTFKIAIEVKSLSATEYNTNQLTLKNHSVGKLSEYCSTPRRNIKKSQLRWEETGGTTACKHSLNCSAYSSNEPNQCCANARKKFLGIGGDGLGQLRAYCLSFSHFQKGITTAVLTNGEEWTILGGDFTNDPCSPLRTEQQIILGKITDDNFLDRLMTALRSS